MKIILKNQLKVGEHISSSLSIFTNLSFNEIENKHHVWKGRDYMKKSCGCLKNHARKVINLKKNKMKFLTNEESYENAKIYFICKKKLR